MNNKNNPLTIIKQRNRQTENLNNRKKKNNKKPTSFRNNRISVLVLVPQASSPDIGI
jgi:hypothetical protein